MRLTKPNAGCKPIKEIVDEDTPLASASLHQAPGIGNISRKVAYGTIWSAGGRIAGLLASFVSTPFLTRLLGVEQYGIWTLANTLSSYLTFANMGMGTASTKFAAEAHTQKDERGEVAVVWTSLLITCVPATTGVLLVILAADPLIEHIFAVPKQLQSLAAMVVRLTALGFAARVFAEILNTPQLVRMRIDLYASINTVLLVAQHGAVVFALLLGGGLGGVVWTVTAFSILTAVAHALASRKLLPALFGMRINKALIKPLLQFGSGVVMSAVLSFVLTNAERLILAHFGTVRELAYYSIAASLAGLVALVPSSMNQSLLPALSVLHASKDKRSFDKLCSQTLSAIVCIMLPAMFLLAIIGEPLLRVWAGAEYAEHSTIPLYILITGVLFNTLAVIPFLLLTAAGHTRKIALCHLIETIPYLIVATLLTYWFGTAGAAIAWSFRTLLDAILLFTMARKIARFPIRALTKDWKIYGTAFIILGGATLFNYTIVREAWVRVGIAGLACTVFFGVIWAKILTDLQRDILLQLVKLRKQERRQ